MPPERDLASQFGVSRPTVREALRALELVGLLEFRPGSTGGGIVANGADVFISKALVLLYQSGAFTLTQLYAARTLLEPMLIGEIMQQPGAAEVIGGLRADVALAEAAFFRRDLRPRVVVDFHGALGKSVANPALSLLMSSLVHATHDINDLYTGRHPDVEELIESHRRIVMLMAAHKQEAAQQAMATHLRETSDFYANLQFVSNGHR